MIKSKKADLSAEKIIFYIASTFVLAIIIIFIVGILFQTRASRAKIPEGLENFIYIQRFLNSPYCFAYQDKDTSRHYTGIIDWDKFTEYNLNYCYNTKDKNVKGFRLKLTNLDTKEESSLIKTNNWEDNVREEIQKDTRIYKNGKIYDGKLVVEIQNAK